MNRYKKVSLEEMLNMLVESIIQKKEAPTFYYSVAKIIRLFRNLYQ